MILERIAVGGLVVGACALAIGCGDSPDAGSRTPQPPTAASPSAETNAPRSAANAFIGSIAVDPADGTVFLGTGYGLLRVAPGDKTTERVVGELRTPDASGQVSSSLLVRFAAQGQLLASGHPEGGGSALPENLGLIRSTDGGATWEPVSELGRADFHSLQAVGEHVVAVGYEEENVQVSTDGGRTFSARTPPAVPVDVAFDPGDPARMVVTTEQGVFTSPDGGASWRPRDNVASEHLAWFASDELYRSDPGGLVQLSRDGGETWEERGSMRRTINALAVDEDGVLYASVAGGEVRSSSDGGATWKPFVVLK